MAKVRGGSQRVSERAQILDFHGEHEIYLFPNFFPS